MLIKAELKNYRQSPQKVRLVADLVRGKKVGRALGELKFLNKKASSVIAKLIDSAVANAKHNVSLEKEVLFIKEIRVDEGPTLKRWRAGARGRAFPLKRRTSRVLLVLSDGLEMEVKQEKKEQKVVKSRKKVVKKTTAKKVAKKTKTKVTRKPAKKTEEKSIK